MEFALEVVLPMLLDDDIFHPYCLSITVHLYLSDGSLFVHLSRNLFSFSLDCSPSFRDWLCNCLQILLSAQLEISEPQIAYQYTYIWK